MPGIPFPPEQAPPEEPIDPEMGEAPGPDIEGMLGEQFPGADMGAVPAGLFKQDELRAELPESFAWDIESRNENDLADYDAEAVPEPDTPSLQEEVGAGDTSDPDVEYGMSMVYGSEFPLMQTEPDEKDWASWAKAMWAMHRTGVEDRMHLVERNRLFRRGIHWISAQGMGPWREPPKPKESVRVVDNMVAPALDQRLQIIAEQRPGFRTRPETHEQKDMEKAEAQQVALEYQYTQQKMSTITREACYWNGTDGVSFLHLFWNPDRGPWDEVMIASKDGEPQQKRMPLGDIETEVLRMEEVRVSAEASATKAPAYWILRKVIPTAQAIRMYGADVLDAETTQEYSLQTESLNTRVGVSSTLPDALLRDLPTVDRFTVYCEKSEYLTEGLHLVVVGNKVVAGPMPLMFGCVPVVRWTDGSTDPNFYPEAIMEGWIDSQMRVNVLKSKWIDSIRVNSGGRFLAKENSIGSETLLGGVTSILTVKGPGALRDSIEAMQGFSVGNDVKEALEIERKAFEDRSGWNDTSRGSFSSDQSGRAILAIREQLERAFAPPVNAASEAMTKWAEISLSIMRWGYDSPRYVSIEGAGRPDLVRALTSDDFDGVANVSIDPETLMPMPRALRLFLLDSMLQKGAITMQDYKRRLPFAFTRDLDSPDIDQSARAMRLVEAIRQSGNPQALPMLWQDDEAVHQDALQKHLILPDDLPFEHPVRQAAIQRWQMLAQQAMMKMPQAPPAPGGGGGGGTPPKLSPQEQPFGAQTAPGIAAGTAAQMGGTDSAAQAFEGSSPT